MLGVGLRSLYAFQSRQAARSFGTVRTTTFSPLKTNARIPTNSITTTQKRCYQRRFNPNRFKQTTGFFHRWAARPTFYYEVTGIGGACAGFYIFNLDEVAISGRRRFNFVPEWFEKWSGESLYQETLNQYRSQLLPENHPAHRMCQRVLERLIPHTGLTKEDNNWELHVIASDETNAFVIPGGKVFVFTGILNVCQDDDHLAAVLSHEIAHNVAHHAGERMSQAYVLLPLALAAFQQLGLGDFAGMSRILIDLAFLRPGSRKQEAEADHIGLLIMSEACYDPRAAVDLWTRMDELGEGQPPQFLSTHPSNHNRRAALEGWLPQAELKREAGGCGATAGWRKY